MSELDKAMAVVESHSPNLTAQERQSKRQAVLPEVRPHPKINKERPLTRELKKMLREETEFVVERDGVEETITAPRLRVILERLMQKAMEGEPWAVNLIFDRVEGKPGVESIKSVQKLEIAFRLRSADGSLSDPFGLLPMKRVEAKVIPNE